MDKKRSASTSSNVSKESNTGAATNNTTEQQTSKSEKDKVEGEYADDFEREESNLESQPKGTEGLSIQLSLSYCKVGNICGDVIFLYIHVLWLEIQIPAKYYITHTVNINSLYI